MQNGKLSENLPFLTTCALVLGLAAGAWFGGPPSEQALDLPEFVREARRGARMGVLLQAPELKQWAASREPPPEGKVVLPTTPKIYVPDQFAISAFRCEEGAIWFHGTVTSVQVYDFTPHMRAAMLASGLLYRCRDQGRKEPVAEGVTVAITAHSADAPQFIKLNARVSYVGFLADFFVGLLLTMFIPVLTASLLKTVLDSAGTLRQFGRAMGLFFTTSCVAACAGGLAGYLFNDSTVLSGLKASALSLAAGTAGEYDPHPFLTQLQRIFLANPMQLITDPTSYSGVQVAMIAILLGLVLCRLPEQKRAEVSRKLREVLPIYQEKAAWKEAVSHYAVKRVIPVGIFFVVLKAVATTNVETALRSLWGLFAATLCALVVHVFLVLVWLRSRRNWSEWVEHGLRPAVSGLLAALATASSYAALPAMNRVPLVNRPNTRGVFDLGMMLNKNGTAVYVAAAAAFVIFGSDGATSFWGIAQELVLLVLLSALSSTAAAGVPFAAVFALQMVLAASNFSAGLAWLIMFIDPVIDRLVTAVNVFCNLAACSSAKEFQQSTLADSVPALPLGLSQGEDRVALS